jgi:hypothetical protein
MYDAHDLDRPDELNGALLEPADQPNDAIQVLRRRR